MQEIGNVGTFECVHYRASVLIPPCGPTSAAYHAAAGVQPFQLRALQHASLAAVKDALRHAIAQHGLSLVKVDGVLPDNLAGLVVNLEVDPVLADRKSTRLNSSHQ